MPRATLAPPTGRQAEVLAFVRERQRTAGLTPTLEEISAHFGFHSANAAREHLRLLQKKGYLKRDPGKPRMIRLSQQFDKRSADVVRIPLLGRIPAGVPSEAIEEVEEILVLPSRLFRGERLFALRVDGVSMLGAGILNGDVVVLDAAREAADGVIAAVVTAEEATLKRIYRTRTGLRLVAENPDVPERIIPRDHLDTVRIAGVLVGLLRTC